MFMQVEQGTKHPEAGPRHKCTQMFTVVIGYPRNYQIRVIKLIRGWKVLKTDIACTVSNVVGNPRLISSSTYHVTSSRQNQPWVSDDVSQRECLI